MEQKEAIKSNALSEKCFIRPGQKLAILIIGSVLLSLTFVYISMWLYSATGAEQVDLSRPGFKDVRGQSFQRNERGFEALVLTLVSNLALICDHLSPSAQFMGSPKRLIRIEPEPTFPKFSAFENIHAYAYAYACILLW